MDPATLSRRFRKEWSWLALIWLLVAAGMFWLLWLNWQTQQLRTGERLLQRLDIVQSNLARQLLDIDFLLRSSLQQPDAQPSALPHNLSLIPRLKPSILTMNLLDAHGDVIQSSDPAFIHSNYAHRDYFALAHQPEFHDRLIVSSPFLSERDGWLMVLARTRLDSSGQFDGLISATLNPREFATLLTSVQFNEHMVSQLAHENGLEFIAVDAHGSHSNQQPLPADSLIRHYLESERSQPLWNGPGDQPGHHYLLGIRPVCLNDDSCLPLLVTLGSLQRNLLPALLRSGFIPLFFWLLTGLGGSILLDINHRRRRQLHDGIRAAREREQQLNTNWRTILEAIDQAVWEWDRLSDQVRYSLPWKKRLGYSEHELDNSLDEWKSRIHPDDLMNVIQALQNYIDGQSPDYHCSYRLRKKSGDYLWILDRALIVERDSRGYPTRLIGTHVDISPIQNERSLLEKLAANIPGILYQYRLDPNGYFSFPYASRDLKEIFGHNQSELNTDSNLLFRCIHPEDREPLRDSLNESASSLGYWRQQYRVVQADGRERWIQDQANPVRLADGSTLWNGHLMDITESRIQSMQLAETERLLKHLMNELPIGLAMLDDSQHLYFRNRWFRRLFPVDNHSQPALHEWLRKAIPDALPREQVLLQWQQDRQQAEAGDGYIPVRHYQLRVKGNRYASVSLSGLTFGRHCLAILEDNSSQQDQHAFLHALAYQDGLTGLANRRRFDESLQAEWQRCRRTGKPLSALMMDIDHFKAFNDLYGHQAGDHCLIRIARTLQNSSQRAQDLLARYGGEEFVCLLPESGLGEACRLAEKLRKAVEALNIEHRGAEGCERVTISIGVCCAIPGNGLSAEALIHQADMQLYQAKQQGRNRVAGCRPAQD